MLGWMTGLLATPVFIPLAVHGYRKGLWLVLVSLTIAGAGALLIQQGEIFIFSLTMVPLGVTLYNSVRIGDSPVKSGVKGLIALAMTWVLFWTAYGTLAGASPYNMLLKTLNLGLEQAVELSMSNEAELSPDMALRLKEATSTIREAIPRVLPGLLMMIVVFTVWLNMVLINSLNGRLTKTAPWGHYTTWRLPEYLVWVLIGASIAMLFGTGWLQNAGGWLVMIASLLYSFQGLAVLIALFERWRVPPFIQIVLYVVVFLQTYGMLLLAVLGLIDVWYDFRKTKETNA
jgi:Predicted membrane protein (DUF2232).